MSGAKHVLAALLLGSLSTVLGQEGSIDPTFNPGDLGDGLGDGADVDVLTTVVQPDGKILIGGEFTHYNGVPRNRMARLNTDGTLDSAFATGSGADGDVAAVVLHPDGDLVIGGEFNSYGGVVCNGIAQLNSDGTLDADFNAGSGANNDVQALALQADGKILIAGYFTAFNGVSRNRIARLNSDGSLDTSFDPGSGASGLVHSLALTGDGKIIICGSFGTYNGTPRNRIARLNADGSLDAAFDPGVGANGSLLCLALQPDGQVIIGGSFTTISGMGRNRVARLNADGSLDASFQPVLGANATVRSATLRSDGRSMIAGDFTTYSGQVRNRVALLNTDGTLDLSFDPGPGASSDVYSIVLQPDGKAIIAGDFVRYGDQTVGRTTRLNNNGSLDPSFNFGTGANGEVFTTVFQPDGKILIGGAFTRFNGVVRKRIARLNPDGSLDGTFDPGNVAPLNYVVSIAVQADGKIVIGGYFNGRLARLNADGSLDTSFNMGAGVVGSSVRSIVLQPDGKLLIGGAFSSYAGTARNNIARLNADGTLDAAFDPGSGAFSIVSSIAHQSDGKIVIAGYFVSYNGVGRNRIARLNANGSLDSGFDPGAGANNAVASVVVQPDGRILVAGQFTSVAGTTRNRIARLNPDGSLDAGFDPAAGANSTITCMALQPNGYIVVGGDFTAYDGVGRNRIARSNPEGLLDLSFDPGSGLDHYDPFQRYANSVAFEPDGKIIVAGNFTSFNGTGRNRVARIHGTARTSIKVMLEGPYSGGQMTDALRTLPSFPLTEPFSAMGYAEATYVPGASIPAGLLTTTGNNAIVDWVIVEMRPVATPGVVAASRAVLLQRDGDVVDLDGVSTVGFAGLANGSYCVAVKPRTHLPVMLSTSTPAIYGDAIATVDFTLPATQVHDSDALKNVGGTMVLAMGDATFNEKISYTGLGNDRDPILVRIGGSIPTATVAGYYPEDVNMDGVVKYVGVNNDRDPILTNVGGSTPTVVRDATLP